MPYSLYLQHLVLHISNPSKMLAKSTMPGRPTEAVTDLGILTANFRSIKEFLGNDLRCMAVVKANAYGHGAIACARALETAGVDWFAVAIAEEGLELRSAGITKPILCLGGVWPGQADKLLTNNITPTLLTIENAELIHAAAIKTGRPVDVHIKVDTGMGRVGLQPEQLDSFLERLKQLPYLKLDGILTHFAVADDRDQDEFTHKQLSVFQDAVALARSKGFVPTYIDAANTPGTFGHPESRLSMVRLGGMLYGLIDDILPENTLIPRVKPVLSLTTRIAQVKKVAAGKTLGYGRTYTAEKDIVVATVPIGYNDGYRRAFSNKARAIVNGREAKVVGRVSMDWTMLDVSDVEGVKPGDKVTLIGTDGDLSIRTEELSQIAGTISYEITCGLSSRITRRYIESNSVD